MDEDFFRSSSTGEATRIARTRPTDLTRLKTSTVRFGLPPAVTTSLQIHRSALVHYQVICQVIDCFIIVKCQDYLLCFDQHAVDERIRVDAFTKAVYDSSSSTQDLTLRSRVIRRQPLKPPITLTDLSEEEFEALSQPIIQHFLARFHLEYQLLQYPHPTLIIRSGPFIVNNIPFSIPDLVTGLLADIRQAAPGWPQHLRPSTIQYILNSKACRGAIMFNTALGRFRCRKLLHRLSQTSFPFQCAHGRPSVVPLCKLSDYLTTRGKKGNGEEEQNEVRPRRFNIQMGHVPTPTRLKAFLAASRRATTATANED